MHQLTEYAQQTSEKHNSDNQKKEETQQIDLPAEVWCLILSFLEQKDLALLCQVSTLLQSIVTLHQRNKPFISAINREVKQLGYNLPRLEYAYIGVDLEKEQTSLLNLLRKHKGILSSLDLIAKLGHIDQLAVSRKKEIATYLENLETLLKFPMEEKTELTTCEETKITYLLSSITELQKKTELNSKSLPIYNPLLLRLYVEVLRISALINKQTPSVIYNKLFLACYLLTKMGDASGYFGMMDIVTKSLKKENSVLIDYVCELNKNHQLFLFNTEAPTDFLVGLMSTGFKRNNLQVFNASNESRRSKFQYTLAFFFPQVTITLVSQLTKAYGNDTGLILFLNIPQQLFECFLADYNLFYTKIFTELRPTLSNLKLLEQCLAKNSESAIAILLSISRQPILFNLLSLEQIMRTPLLLLPLLRSHQVKDTDNWSEEYASFLTSKFERFHKVACVVRYWMAADIVLLLNSEAHFFELIAACGHRETLFSRSTYSTLEILSKTNYVHDARSLLKLFCENSNILVIKALLESREQGEKLTEKINNNRVVNKLLVSKNANALLRFFPKYYHFVRREHVKLEGSFKLLLSIAENNEFFLLVLKLCNGLDSNFEKNLKLIRLLNNPIVFEYVQKMELSFDDINKHYKLFQLLSIFGRKASHIYLLSVSFSDLIMLFELKLLNSILYIKSETLCAWLLFGISPLPHYYKFQTNLKLRSNVIIEDLLLTAIVFQLDRFGFSVQNSLKTEFKHCDREITELFSIEQLKELNKISSHAETLLSRICIMNCNLFSLALNRAKMVDNFSFQAFAEFYNLPFWNVTDADISWLLWVYFDEVFLEKLSRVTIDEKCLLRLLTSKDYHSLFYQLLNHAKTKTKLDVPFIKNAHLPSQYALDQVVFMGLINAICVTGLIFYPENCSLLFQKFTAKEILYLNNLIVDSTSKITLLNEISHLASQDVDSFTYIVSSSNNVQELSEKIQAQAIDYFSIKKYDICYLMNSNQNNLKRSSTEDGTRPTKYLREDGEVKLGYNFS